MKRYNEAQELAARDIVARAIVRRNAPHEREHVYLEHDRKPKASSKNASRASARA